jgi:hypothetical protein
MAFEGDLVESLHLALEFHAEDFARVFGNGSDLVKVDAGATAHSVRIATGGTVC